MKNQELVNKAVRIMRVIEENIGQTIGLATLQEDVPYGEVLAEVKGTSGFGYHLEIGYNIPLHTSSPGKVFLAYLSPAKRAPILDAMDFQKYTPSTITDRDDFIAELDDVREKGYAIDVSEQIEGCHCVGVPVFNDEDRVIAAIWTTGPSSQLPVRIFPKIASILKKEAQELTRSLCENRRSPNRAHINSVIEQGVEIMQRNLDQPIDIKTLAANLYVSYSWFRKAFKEQTGIAPSEYHLNLRIEKAKELLKSTDLPIRQISEELGFKNQNHFSALFKRKTTLSPANFRKT